MKIGIIGDTHLGNKRFYEESFLHLERALNILEKENCDVILHTGDMFDTKDITLQTLHRTFLIFNKIKKQKVIAICGNHEKRAKDEINAVKLLSDIGCFEYLHNKVLHIDDFSFLAMSHVNEADAQAELDNIIKQRLPEMREKKVLMIHQNIKDYSPGDGIELKYLKSLGFFLIVNGHIHKRIYDWPVILPGSLLATSINEDEAKPRGVTVIDTNNCIPKFIEIEQRPIVIKQVHFNDATKEEIINTIKEIYKEEKQKNEGAIIKLILKGSTKNAIVDFFNIMSFKDLFLDMDIKKADLKEAVSLWKEQYQEAKLKMDDDNALIKILEGKVEKPEQKLKMLYDYNAEQIAEIYLKESDDINE
ncbi:MAG: metallophosphoesterase [Candidatus Anstonellales archaeon]